MKQEIDNLLETTTVFTNQKIHNPCIRTKNDNYDYLAPDTSEIRLLLTEHDTVTGSLAHCTLPPASTSIACMHKSVDELWYFISGHGEIWLKNENTETTTNVNSGTSISIPAGTMFQFRNLSQHSSLEFVVTTFPYWPGASESTEVEGKWQPSNTSI